MNAIHLIEELRVSLCSYAVDFIAKYGDVPSLLDGLTAQFPGIFGYLPKKAEDDAKHYEQHGFHGLDTFGVNP